MIDTLSKALDAITGLPVGLLTVVVTLIIGFTLKKTRRFPNDLIPLAVIVCGTVSSVAIRYGFGRFIVEGMVYSGLAWMFHKFIWKAFIARFFPMVKGADKEFDSNPELVRRDPPKTDG